jgi:mono/diheme cytochrome c family protein
MLRTIKILTMLTAGVAFFVLLAQTEADYQGYMKSVVDYNKKVQKGIAAKDASIAADATALAGVFKQVEAFWTNRNVADAVGFAKAAQTAAMGVAKAAAANDFDTAATEGKNLAAQCGNCHGAHREKGESGFKIK